MITRRNTIALAVITAVCFVTAGVLGNHHEGLRQAVADVAWFGFLLGMLLLIDPPEEGLRLFQVRTHLREVSVRELGHHPVWE